MHFMLQPFFQKPDFLHKTISQTFTLLSANESELLQAITTALAPIPKLICRVWHWLIRKQCLSVGSVFAAGPPGEQVSLDCSYKQLLSIETNAWKGKHQV